jgi:hypothetical protein
MLLFQVPMRVEHSKEHEVNGLLRVKTKGRVDQETMDLSKTNVALHIGKQDPHHDFLLSFAECSALIRGECKFSESGATVVFAGRGSKDSFWNEQKQASQSKCKLQNNFFLFVTNAHMVENEKEQIVDEMSMFINKERWTEAFSPIFEFLKDL